MVKKILLILLPVLAFLGGSSAGAMFRGGSTATETSTQDHDAQQAEADISGGHAAPADPGHDEEGDGTVGWFRFPSQFFVPVVRNGGTEYVMIMTVTLEIPKSAQAEVEALEHRLRDALLRQLIIHANTGGFDGNFTSDAQLRKLRDGILTAAQSVAHDNILSVLIEDIARKEN